MAAPGIYPGFGCGLLIVSGPRGIAGAAGGVPHTVVTVTLGNALTGSSNVRTSTSSVAMLWSPTAAVTSLAGSPSSTAPVTETVAPERDF